MGLLKFLQSSLAVFFYGTKRSTNEENAHSLEIEIGEATYSCRYKSLTGHELLLAFLRIYSYSYSYSYMFDSTISDALTMKNTYSFPTSIYRNADRIEFIDNPKVEMWAKTSIQV